MKVSSSKFMILMILLTGVAHCLPHHAVIAPAPTSFLMDTMESDANKHIEKTSSISEQRSLFHDVIDSLRKRDDLSKNILDNPSNTMASKFDEYYYNDNDQVIIQGELDSVSRRNDRHDFSVRRRNPKLFSYYRIAKDNVKEEDMERPKSGDIVVSIDTQKLVMGTTVKPKKPAQPQKRSKPVIRDLVKSGQKSNQIKDGEHNVVDESEDTIEVNTTDQPQSSLPHRPQNNNMSGQSQIGNRESQMVIKPTIIVNFRGSVSNRDSDIRLEGPNDENSTSRVPSPNVFNINPEVNIEKTYAILDENRDTVNHDQQRKQNSHRRQSIEEKVRSTEVLVTDLARGPDLEQPDADDMIMSETILDTSSTNSSSLEEEQKQGRKLYTDESIAILLTVQEKNGKKTPFIFNIGPLGGFLSLP